MPELEEVIALAEKKFYLDNAASTPLDPRVLEAMQPFFSEKFGNASSLHSFGREAREALENAREKIARAIGAEKEEIIFTSGGTESNNLALQGMSRALKGKGRHIIVSAIEHPCIINTAKFLQGQGFEVTFLPVDVKGLAKPDEFEKALRKDTILVSVMLANHEIGAIQPIEEIGKICQERKIAFHSDAVQALGKIPVDVNKLKVDLLSLSSHKVYGPKGIGVLYVRKGTGLKPVFFGGGHEHGLRSGTENVAGAVGFAKAVELCLESLAEESKRLSGLRDRLVKEVLEKVPDSRLNGDAVKRLPNNANFSFKFIEGEALLMLLDEEGIAVSTGSACSSKSLEPSHILLAIGLSLVEAHGSLRVSLGRFNGEEDIDMFLAALPKAVEKLRSFSPLKESKEGK